MNDKLRFIVFTALVIGFLPMTVMVLFIAWLMGLKREMIGDYICFYQKTWKRGRFA